MALVRIPGGITLDHFSNIRNIQVEILTDLEIRRTGAKRLVNRLNNSERNDPSPVFVGIIEDKDVSNTREQRNEPDPGLYRFGDDNYSVIYKETVSDPLGNILERDWNPTKDYYEKSGTAAKALTFESGLMYQRFIAIRIREAEKIRSVGTLTVAFDKNPVGQTMEVVRDRMKFYAQSLDSPLVKYLQNTFRLGGPTF